MVRGAGGGVRHARLDTVGSNRVGRGPDALRLDGIYKDECGQEGPAVAVALAVYGGRETPARAMAQREHHGMWVIFHHGEKRSMIHVSLLLLDDEILVMYSQVQNLSGDPSDLGVATSGARAASGPSWSGPCLRVCTCRQLHSAAASHLKRYSCAVYATADSHNERRSFGTGPLPACPRCSLPRSRFPLQVVGKAGSVFRFGPVSLLRGGRLGGPAPTVVAHDAPQSAAAL